MEWVIRSRNDGDLSGYPELVLGPFKPPSDFYRRVGEELGDLWGPYISGSVEDGDCRIGLWDKETPMYKGSDMREVMRVDCGKLIC